MVPWKKIRWVSVHKDLAMNGLHDLLNCKYVVLCVVGLKVNGVYGIVVGMK